MGVIQGGSVIEGAIGRGVPGGLYEYDFAIDGGAVGSIPLRPIGSSKSLPNNFVVLNTVLEILTVLNSGGSATAALQINAAGDVVTATAFGSAPWSTTGRKAGAITAAASSVKTTAVRAPTLVVATAALTGGRFRLFVSGYDADRS